MDIIIETESYCWGYPAKAMPNGEYRNCGCVCYYCRRVFEARVKTQMSVQELVAHMSVPGDAEAAQFRAWRQEGVEKMKAARTRDIRVAWASREDLHRRLYNTQETLDILEEPEVFFWELPEYIAKFGDPNTNGLNHMQKKINSMAGVEVPGERVWKLKRQRLNRNVLETDVADNSTSLGLNQLEAAFEHLSSSSAMPQATGVTLDVLLGRISVNVSGTGTGLSPPHAGSASVGGAAAGSASDAANAAANPGNTKEDAANAAANDDDDSEWELGAGGRISFGLRASYKQAEPQAHAAAPSRTVKPSAKPARATPKKKKPSAQADLTIPKRGRPRVELLDKVEKLIQEFSSAESDSCWFGDGLKSRQRMVYKAVTELGKMMTSIGPDDPSYEAVVIPHKQMQAIHEICKVMAVAATEPRSDRFAKVFDEVVHALSLPPMVANPLPPFLWQHRHELQSQVAKAGAEFWVLLSLQTLQEYKYKEEDVFAARMKLSAEKVISCTQVAQFEEVSSALQDLFRDPPGFRNAALDRQLCLASCLVKADVLLTDHSQLVEAINATAEKENDVMNAFSMFPHGRAVINEARAARDMLKSKQEVVENNKRLNASLLAMLQSMMSETKDCDSLLAALPLAQNVAAAVNEVGNHLQLAVHPVLDEARKGSQEVCGRDTSAEADKLLFRMWSICKAWSLVMDQSEGEPNAFAIQKWSANDATTSRKVVLTIAKGMQDAGIGLPERKIANTEMVQFIEGVDCLFECSPDVQVARPTAAMVRHHLTALLGIHALPELMREAEAHEFREAMTAVCQAPHAGAILSRLNEEMEPLGKTLANALEPLMSASRGDGLSIWPHNGAMQSGAFSKIVVEVDVAPLLEKARGSGDTRMIKMIAVISKSINILKLLVAEVEDEASQTTSTELAINADKEQATSNLRMALNEAKKFKEAYAADKKDIFAPADDLGAKGKAIACCDALDGAFSMSTFETIFDQATEFVRARIGRWLTDATELKEKVLTLFPNWEPLKEELLAEGGAGHAMRQSLLSNESYKLISPAVDILFMHQKHLRNISSDGCGAFLDPALHKEMSRALSLGKQTVVVTYGLSAVAVTLPKLSCPKVRSEQAAKLESQLLSKGVPLPACLTQALSKYKPAAAPGQPQGDGSAPVPSKRAKRARGAPTV